MPRSTKSRQARSSLPPTLPGPELSEFDVQVPSRARVVSGPAGPAGPSTSNVRYNPYPGRNAPGPAGGPGGGGAGQAATATTTIPPIQPPQPQPQTQSHASQGQPSVGSWPPMAPNIGLPSLFHQATGTDSEKDASFECESPPAFTPVALLALVDSLPIGPRKHFVASGLDRHIRIELAGALGSTAIGVGDMYASLLRVLVPEPYDKFGSPSVRSVFQAPVSTLLAQALRSKGVPVSGGVSNSENPFFTHNGEQKPPVNPTTEQPVEVQSAQAQHYTTHRPGPSRVLMRDQSPMAAAYSTVHDWGAVFTSRTAWATERTITGHALPRSALVVAAPFDLLAMHHHNTLAPPPGGPSDAFRNSQHLSATNLIAHERAIRGREALALAVGHAVLLKQTTGHGFGVGIVGSRFSRVVALSDTIVAAELGLVMPAAFTIVNALSHLFDDRAYDRLPNNLTNHPDRLADILCSQAPFSSTNMHFDEAINATAMQRLLDLLAASHTVVDPRAQTQIANAEKPVHDAILKAASNHPAPSYYFPNHAPRHDIGAVWALQLARVVVAEVPPDLMDRLLRELTGAGEPVAPVYAPKVDTDVFIRTENVLPTPNDSAPNTGINLPVPLPNINRDKASPMDFQLPPLNLDPDPNQTSQLVVDPFTGIAKIVTSPVEADTPSPLEKVSRRASRTSLKPAKEPKEPKEPKAAKTKAPRAPKAPKEPKEPKEPKKKASKEAKEPKEKDSAKTRKPRRKATQDPSADAEDAHGNSASLNHGELGAAFELGPAFSHSPSPHLPTPVQGEHSFDFESEE